MGCRGHRSRGRSSGFYAEGGRLHPRNSSGGTTHEGSDSKSPEDFLLQYMSMDKKCQLHLRLSDECFAYTGDSSVDRVNLINIAKCPEKYHEALIERLELERPDKGRPHHSVSGCDEVHEPVRRMETQCGWFSRNYERAVRHHGKEDSLHRLFEKIMAKCPDK